MTRSYDKRATQLATPSPSSRHPVPEPPYREQDLRLVGVFFDLLADAADVDGHVFVRSELVLGPEVVDEGVAADGFAGADGEEVEELELLLGQADRAAVDEGVLHRRVEGQAAGVDDVVAVARAQLLR